MLIEFEGNRKRKKTRFDFLKGVTDDYHGIPA